MNLVIQDDEGQTIYGHLVGSNQINDRLLEAVSNRIELGLADIVSMFSSQSQMQADIQ
jgi:hypothetical protein